MTRGEIVRSGHEEGAPGRGHRPCCPVVELRRYTLHPGRRDDLIALFDRELVDSQEATGMRVIGQFRDLDGPNRFVWLRGFRDMPSRARALAAFYGGPVWRTHRDAANATMIDSDDVLLLRPASPDSGFVLADGQRPPPGAADPAGGLIVATIYSLHASGGTAFPAYFDATLRPILADTGAEIVGAFVTEHAANTYPALPVRTGDDVFMWVARYPDLQAHERHIAALDRAPDWRTASGSALAGQLRRSPEVLRLDPTARSLLRG